MGRITLVLGGARSGKSTHALRLAEEMGKPVTFIATAQAFDDEMSDRIQKHRAERPADWQTLEIPSAVAAHTDQIQSDVVVLDCVTLLVSNLLMQFVENDRVKESLFMQAAQQEIEALISVIHESERHWIIVSNEVGLGLVPPYQMGRVYRDGLGWANQKLAKKAERVILMVAGIPVPIHEYKIRL